MKTFWLAALLLVPLKAWTALVTCAPSSCSPGCDDSCTYQTCSQTNSMSFTLTQLPYAYTTPGGACDDTMDGVTLSQLPFNVDGVTYTTIATSVNHQYRTCETQVEYGPPCPPPPPPLPFPPLPSP